MKYKTKNGVEETKREISTEERKYIKEEKERPSNEKIKRIVTKR